MTGSDVKACLAKGNKHLTMVAMSQPDLPNAVARMPKKESLITRCSQYAHGYSTTILLHFASPAPAGD